MSTPDTRFPALLEQFTGDLQSPIEDVRRRATDDLYDRIIAQYADVSKRNFEHSNALNVLDISNFK
jgi:molybdopterin converting factor small subunit